jgi:hypothetical protein
MGCLNHQMTADEADDFVSEYGTGVTPMQVYGWDREEREERANPRCKCGCPSCPQVTCG